MSQFLESLTTEDDTFEKVSRMTIEEKITELELIKNKLSSGNISLTKIKLVNYASELLFNTIQTELGGILKAIEGNVSDGK